MPRDPYTPQPPLPGPHGEHAPIGNLGITKRLIAHRWSAMWGKTEQIRAFWRQRHGLAAPSAPHPAHEHAGAGDAAP